MILKSEQIQEQCEPQGVTIATCKNRLEEMESTGINVVNKVVGQSEQPTGLFIFICFVLIATASCRMPRFAGVAPEAAYVLTKSDRRIPAEVVEVQQSKKGTKNIIADFEAFTLKTVAAYSDGKAIFHNIGDSQFARKIVSGKINLFTSKLTSSGKPASSKPLHYFAQSGEQGELSRFSYDILKTMIPRDASANKYLTRYRNMNRASYIIGGIALGVTTIGVFQILNDKKGTPGLPTNPSGVLIASIGVWGFLTAAVINEENKANLFYAVKEQNTR